MSRAHGRRGAGRHVDAERPRGEGGGGETTDAFDLVARIGGSGPITREHDRRHVTRRRAGMAWGLGPARLSAVGNSNFRGLCENRYRLLPLPPSPPRPAKREAAASKAVVGGGVGARLKA
ncbi:unnamed protein product [Lampetra planeri]